MNTVETAHRNSIPEGQETGTLLRVQKQVLDAIVHGLPLLEMLEVVARAVEDQIRGEARAAIQLLDAAGTHFNGCIAPSLPESYCKAMKGLAIESKTGPCCLAVLRGETVMVRDITADPRWSVFASFVAPLGIRAAWSSPIISAQGRIIGTFASYYKEARTPDPNDLRMMDVLARTVALAIERKQAEETLQRTTTELSRHVAQLQKTNVDSQNSRRAALNVMEDAIQARQLADRLNLQLRREAAERKEAQTRYRTLVEQVKDYAIFSLDKNGRAISWNEGVRRILGFEEDEFIGIDIVSAIFLPEDVQSGTAQEELRKVAAEGSAGDDRWMQRKDGTRFWASGTTTALRDAVGEIVGFTKVMRDTTSARLAEDALRESREELRKRAQLLDLAHEPIIVRDLEDKVTYWNKGAERLYGWTAKEAIGKNIHTLLRTNFPTSLDRALEQLHSEGYWEGELNQTARDGSPVTVVSRWVMQKDDQGNPVAILDTKFDITERKRSETALRTTEKLATVGRMAATLAHEINNPLESVTNLIYLAREEKGVPEPARRYLMDADEELDRVGHMTKQTLGLYRESTKPQPVRLSGLLKGLLSMYSPRIKTRQIAADLKVVSEIDVCGLTGELRQVFSNLLSNSIDAVGKNGTIRVRVAATHANVNGRRTGMRVMVADNGAGIAAADVKKIFDPFFTTKMNVGTGLGLWVSKEIVEQHGGSIRLRSCAMQGRNWTVASVFLPEDIAGKEKESA